MRNGGKTRFKRTKIDELMNYTVYMVSLRHFQTRRARGTENDPPQIVWGFIYLFVVVLI